MKKKNIKVKMNMKQKIFSLLALLMTVVTASAQAPALELTVGTNEHGTIAFTVNGTDAIPVSGKIAVNENDAIVLTITPDDGWAVDKPSGEWDAAMAKTRADGIGDMQKDFDLTLESEVPTTGTKTYSFTMIRANAKISVKYAKIIQDSWIQNIAAVTYNGSAQKPTVVVKDGTTTLELGTDYTVSYSNNYNARQASATNAPTATVTGKGNYSGTASKTFTINKANGNVFHHQAICHRRRHAEV